MYRVAGVYQRRDKTTPDEREKRCTVHEHNWLALPASTTGQTMAAHNDVVRNQFAHVLPRRFAHLPHRVAGLDRGFHDLRHHTCLITSVCFVPETSGIAVPRPG